MHGATQPDNAQIRTELRQIIANVLDGEPADIDDDAPLLDYVTSSLALLAGIRLVYERFGVLLPIRPLLEGAGTLAALAAHIDQALSDRDRLGQHANGGGDGAAERERPQIPLAASHQHVGFLARYSNGSTSAYNEPLVLRIEGPLQAPALQAAIKSVVERHEALNAALSPDTNALTLDPGAKFDLTVAPCPESEVAQRLSDLVTKPFQPGERLFRAHLLQISPTHHVLALVGHALALDGDALSLVATGIGHVYGVFSGGDAAPVLSTPVELAAYMARHDEPAAREARAVANAHWRDVFAPGIPRLELPADHLRPAVKAYDGARAVVSLDAGLQELLRGWRETAPDAAVFGAYLALLHRLTGSNDIVVGHRSSPMHDGGAQGLVCPIRNVVPVRSGYDPDRSFADQVRSSAQAFADADRYRDFSLAELILALRLPRDQGRAALFSAAFAAQSRAAPPAFGTLRCTPVTAPNARARYDIELTFVSAADGMQLVCDYSTELFDHATVGRWLEGLVEFLRAGLKGSQTSCGRLPIMSERQRQQLLHDWNATERPYPQNRTVLDLFGEQVQAGPDRVAVRFTGEAVTYRQLAQRVDQIASLLHAAGAKAGEPVGVLLPRSPDQIAAMLAAWRIGAPYVPLDPAAPQKRSAFMLEDAGVRVAVTRPELQATIASGTRAVRLDDTVKAEPLDNRVAASRAGDAAYIIYTSGSTGQPKGVEVMHRSLVNCLCGVRDLLGFSAADSALAIATPTFDISTVELFMPLIVGGSVELAEDGVAADGIRLAEHVQACGPSFIQATPSTWKMLLAAGWKGDPKLAMGCGGEPLTRELADDLLGKSRALWNMYGPTEATVNAAVHEVKRGSGQPVPIGRPCVNTQLYILDAQSEPVPIGVVGELCIGGAGVARGYIGKPELTQERFVASRFRSGERLYRSGDLARYLPNGDIVFVGRADDQAKIHGVRVELGEVEASLCKLPGIRDAVASVWTDAAGIGQLVGHIIPAASAAPTVAEIRERLREQLPDAMIPTYILVAKEFPLTTSGKIDRAALPTPDAARRTGRDRVAPATATERSLAAAWASILGIDVDLIGRDDDFLELGGHSLQMTHLLVEVRKRFQVGFSLREFFDASTLRKFAALIQQARGAQALHGNGRAPMHDRDSEWGKQRMAFLRREAELPPSIGPARGLTYRPQAEIKTVLLTGTTGFLGAYLLAEALMTTDAELYCLVRPKQDVSAKDRIEQHLRYLELWRDDDEWRSAFDARVHALEGDVILPRLGLSDAMYEKLAREIDSIIHCAGYVNFIYPYEALKATNVAGVHEIIRFGFNGRIKPVHYMSTAAIWPMGPEYTFYESDPIDHGQLLNMGYDDVKWVGEKCLINAADRGLPVARYRPGEVSGDSRTGRGMLHHFIVAAFKGFLQLGAFPGIETYLDMAPVDYMTKAMVHLVFRRKPLGRAFHLTNPHPMAMSEVLSFFRGLGYQFEEMPFAELRRRLFEDAAFHDNALFPFQTVLESMDDRNFQLPHYDCRQTLAELEGSGIVCPPVDEALLGVYVNYLKSVGYLPEPGAPPSGMRTGIAVQLA